MPQSLNSPESFETYSIYGMQFSLFGSAERLAAVGGAGPADFTLRLGSFPENTPDLGGEQIYGVPGDELGHRNGLRIYRPSGTSLLYFCFPEAIEFLVDPDSRTVAGRWPKNFRLDYVAPLILGPLMGFMLRLFGVTTLHASAVEVDGRAVLLFGPGGAGKSTTAAAFAAAGFGVLSDDLAPIRFEAGGYLVAPGYPRICLWPESVRMLFGDENAMPLITSGWSKRYVDLSGPAYRFVPKPLPVGAVYWIGERNKSLPESSLEPVAGVEAIKALIGNTYAAKFGGGGPLRMTCAHLSA